MNFTVFNIFYNCEVIILMWYFVIHKVAFQYTYRTVVVKLLYVNIRLTVCYKTCKHLHDFSTPSTFDVVYRFCWPHEPV